MKPKLGICMDGGELEFIDAVRSAIGPSLSRRYLEIGLAYGETFHAVWQAIRMFKGSSIIGIELPAWEALHCVSDRFVDDDFKWDDWLHRISVIRKPSTEAIRDLWEIGKDGTDWATDSVAFSFIDACHGKPCVMNDFKAVEPLIEKGGLVAFHDAGDVEQGGDFQPHCKQPIGVQAALKELGLWSNERPGWIRLNDIPTMNRCAVFQKL